MSRRPETPTEAPQHWRNKLDQTDLLERLGKIKDLDGLGLNAIHKYFDALKDKYASVRYWAVIGLHNNCKWPVDEIEARATLKNMLDDPAAVVRIGAAHALRDWDKEKEALPVLAEALKDKTDKARLHAIIALKRLGEKARPVLPQIKVALNDSDEFVQRVARATVKRLEDA